jgi:hypothetical protein
MSQYGPCPAFCASILKMLGPLQRQPRAALHGPNGAPVDFALAAEAQRQTG